MLLYVDVMIFSYALYAVYYVQLSKLHSTKFLAV